MKIQGVSEESSVKLLNREFPVFGFHELWVGFSYLFNKSQRVGAKEAGGKVEKIVSSELEEEERKIKIKSVVGNQQGLPFVIKSRYPAKEFFSNSFEE